MTKRNVRTRRHGTNELTPKGRVSPTASENNEYTMIDLVRSVERLHFCKSGDRKETVLWADVKKHYKKNTGRVLTTETFNKLAGVNGASRKDLIAGPLAGLLVAEDPAALVLRFKYDATKGDPLINHRYYLEASGAKTSVHHADENISPRLARASNTVSPSRSETSSSSLSPTCLSSISTDPDTEALSPLSAVSPLSSAPLSPETRDEFVTANDDDLNATSGDRSFLTARTSPITSDWESSPSSHGPSTETSSSPLNGSFDQEKTLNLLDVSAGAAETTIGASEVLVDMESAKEESVKGEEKKMEMEREREEEMKMEEHKEMKEEQKEREEEGSDKENHVTTTPLKQSEEKVEDDVIDGVTVHPEAKTVDDDDEVIVEPEGEIVEETMEIHQKTPDVVDEAIEKKEVEEEKEKPAEVIEEAAPTEEKKEVEEKEEEEEKHVLAAGDAPLPSPQSIVDDVHVVSSVVDATSPVTTSDSDEHLLTVIERPAPPTIPPVEEEEHKEEEHSVEKQPEEVKEEEKEMEMQVKEDVVVVEKKEEQEEELAAGDVPPASVEVKAAVVEVMSVEDKEGVREEEEKKEKEEEEKREEEERPVEEVKEVESTTVTKPLEEISLPKEEEERVEEKINEVAAAGDAPAAAEKVEEETTSSTTEEHTATTMVAAAAVVPMQQVQQHQATPPPPPSHEPMETISLNSYSSSTSSTGGRRHIDRPPSPTSDDVDMNDILAGGPNRDVHTPSVTAPITLQPKPANRLAQPEEDDDEEVITSQPIDELDSAPSAAVASAASTKEEGTAATPDLALRRAAPAKKFPCCTIV